MISKKSPHILSPGTDKYYPFFLTNFYFAMKRLLVPVLWYPWKNDFNTLNVWLGWGLWYMKRWVDGGPGPWALVVPPQWWCDKPWYHSKRQYNTSAHHLSPRTEKYYPLFLNNFYFKIRQLWTPALCYLWERVFNIVNDSSSWTKSWNL